ncbi:MAG: Zn-ribbon domain-containing OB-fold protein [Candidatus Heimdallarchaeota archaeon]|nr:Zn-ribbon domain-containing OB-fold protein [Candidatus Heimdallarchaeota archaeon]MCK4878360.1 Zn-ribbon domain-containing OB-fold protein [Candidatus Heimdallarchaeota archaeon]
MEPPKIWREKRERYLAVGIKCLDCENKSFPKSEYCIKCSSSNVEEYKLANTGKLLYYAQVTQTAQEMMEYTPYIVGIVELDDAIKVTGQIVDCNLDEIKEGMPLRMVFKILARDGDEGLIRYGFKFAPS